MKKLEWKGFITGVLIATIGVSTVFAANGIKSAVYNNNKVIVDGKTLDLTGNQMISVVKEGETAASNYMPVRAVLEQMGYTVDWDGESGTVIITSDTVNLPNSTSSSEVNNSVTFPLENLIIGKWQVLNDVIFEFTTDNRVIRYDIVNGELTHITETTYYLFGDAIYTEGNYPAIYRVLSIVNEGNTLTVQQVGDSPSFWHRYNN